MILRTAQFLLANQFLLELLELFEDQVDHLPAGFKRGPGVNGETPGVPVGAQLGEDGIGQTALLSNVLEQAGAHASPEQGVENIRDVSPFVRKRVTGNTETDVNLFERLLISQADASVSRG